MHFQKFGHFRTRSQLIAEQAAIERKLAKTNREIAELDGYIGQLNQEVKFFDALVALRGLVVSKNDCKHFERQPRTISIEEAVCLHDFFTTLNRCSVKRLTDNREMTIDEHIISRTDPVLWERDIWNAATREAVAAFNGTVVAPCVIKPMIWYIPGDVEGGMHADANLAVRAVYTSPKAFIYDDIRVRVIEADEHARGERSLRVTGAAANIPFNEPIDPLMIEKLVTTYAAEYGESPHAFESAGALVQSQIRENALRNICESLAAAQFLQLKVVAKERRTLPRAERRRREREGRPAPDVYAVVLRRAEHHDKPHTQAEAEEELTPEQVQHHREYTCQWLVGGHWRRQFYPSVQEHRPKYIEPYIKGPTDRPMKIHATSKVFVARR